MEVLNMRRLLTTVALVVPLAFAGGTAVAVPESAPSATSSAIEAESNHGATTKAADVCNYTIRRPTLKIGSSGRAVQQAQCYLNRAMSGADLAEDGNFGPVTNAATRRFQACAGITVDGLIGAQTWSSLVFWANGPDFVC
ncbi:peptidoglycan-binding protein [Streptomyces sp. NBC_00190]|uniref:peptidoglycan-binding domain-containing protein n=2 Tax=Streptomyces TaxID=1883 RepID=UPI002E2820F8|nr:peptidoglycan-binding domain-containing protein [Streptomyces sp. NBC_00190]